MAPVTECARLISVEFTNGRLVVTFETVTLSLSLVCALELERTIGKLIGDEG
jgi:hypothetical protein